MNLERPFLGMSLRSWLASLIFLSAAGVVVGYVQLVSGGFALLRWVGLGLGVLGILLGAFPPGRTDAPGGE